MSGCPGSRMMDFGKAEAAGTDAGKAPSRLRQWPIQLHLVSPQAPYYRGADVVLAADCVAFALGSFHEEFLKGKALAIACPKLDSGQEIYLEKIRGLLEESGINSLTVVIMEVPCCRGLLGLAAQALKSSSRKVPLRTAVVGIQGNIVQDSVVEG
jgi:hypothetical protein